MRPSAISWKIVPFTLVAMLALLITACGGDDDPEPSPTATATTAATSPTAAPSPTATPVPIEGNLVVFAATSLTNVFGEIGEAFTTANPDVEIEFNFAGSSALATQINERAPADVFASADGAQMRVVTDAGNGEGEATIFATNRPVVIAPAGNTTVASFEDLANPGVALVLAGPTVPIGNYAREIFTKASGAGGVSADFSNLVLANLQSDEANVGAVLTKVRLGEADAGVVYETDATSAGSEVTIIEIPEQFNVVAQYPIIPLKEAENPEAAAAFVDFVLSEEGQEILAKWGFGSPAPVQPASTSMEIKGRVATPLTVSVADIEGGTTKTVTATNRDGQQVTYTGVPIASLFEEAGVESGATEAVFTASDGYTQTVTLDILDADENAVIVVEDGALRNILPSQPPRTWVRLLVSIEIR